MSFFFFFFLMFIFTHKGIKVTGMPVIWLKTFWSKKVIKAGGRVLRAMPWGASLVAQW